MVFITPEYNKEKEIIISLDKIMNIRKFKSLQYYWKNENVVPHILCHSSPETITIADLFALEPNALEDFKNISLKYTETQGNTMLRQEIARFHEGLDESNILVTNGGSEGIYLAMMSLLQPSDHVIVQFPLFQSLYELAIARGCDVSRWEMRPKRDWELNVDDLEVLIRPNTKLIVINVPHNPTGYTLSRETFERILRVAERKGIYLFSDESNRFLVYNKDDLLPAAIDLYDKAITLGGMSKSLALPGLHVGWLVVHDAKLLNKFLSLKDYMTSGVSTSSEFLAALAFRHRDQLLERIVNIIKSNLGLLNEFFEKHSDVVSWVPPRAGSICFPKILFETEDFCQMVRKEAGILLMPGSAYDYSNEYFRIGFGRIDMPKVLGLFSDYLDKLKKSKLKK